MKNEKNPLKIGKEFTSHKPVDRQRKKKADKANMLLIPFNKTITKGMESRLATFGRRWFKKLSKFDNFYYIIEINLERKQIKAYFDLHHPELKGLMIDLTSESQCTAAYIEKKLNQRYTEWQQEKHND